MFILNSKHFSNRTTGFWALGKREQGWEPATWQLSTVPKETLFFASERFHSFSKKTWYLNATSDYVIDTYKVLTHILTLC